MWKYSKLESPNGRLWNLVYWWYLWKGIKAEKPVKSTFYRLLNGFEKDDDKFN